MWFSVRHFTRNHLPGSDGFASYEERVTIWDADDFEAAYALAKDDAERYATAYPHGVSLPLFHVFRLFDTPGTTFSEATTAEIFTRQAHGAEVFSLIRESQLDLEQFIEQVVSLGAELETVRVHTFEA